MAKQQSKPGSLGSIYTGPKSKDPGVLKAKSDKAKAKATADAYAKKSSTEKATAISKAKKK